MAAFNKVSIKPIQTFVHLDYALIGSKIENRNLNSTLVFYKYNTSSKILIF